MESWCANNLLPFLSSLVSGELISERSYVCCVFKHSQSILWEDNYVEYSEEIYWAVFTHWTRGRKHRSGSAAVQVFREDAAVLRKQKWGNLSIRFTGCAGCISYFLTSLRHAVSSGAAQRSTRWRPWSRSQNLSLWRQATDPPLDQHGDGTARPSLQGSMALPTRSAGPPWAPHLLRCLAPTRLWCRFLTGSPSTSTPRGENYRLLIKVHDTIDSIRISMCSCSAHNVFICLRYFF